MPNLVSSKKRMRQERTRRSRNTAIKSGMRTAIKKLRESKEPEALNRACSALDKAAKRGLIHHRNAARRKSRLTKMVNAQT